jgi:hypothetical protein
MAFSPARQGGELFCSQQHGQRTLSLLCGGSKARWEFRATIGEISGAVDKPPASPGTVHVPPICCSVLEGSACILSGPGGLSLSGHVPCPHPQAQTSVKEAAL